MQAQFSKNKVGMADSMETISLALFYRILTEPKVGWKRLKLYDFENSLMLLHFFPPKIAG